MFQGLTKISFSYLDSTSGILKASLFLFITIFSILFLFEPFGEIRHGNTIIGIFRIGSYALVSSVIFYLFERYIKPKFINVFSFKASVFIWYLLSVSAMAICIFLLKNGWSGFKYFTISGFGVVLYRVLIIAFFILLIISVLYNYIHHSSEHEVLLKSVDSNPEYLRTANASIVFLESEKNYTTVHYEDGVEIKKKILRGSLNYFARQLPNSFIRTHRSFIVNLNSIESVTGNSQGLNLKLKNISVEVKVSRKYLNSFQKNWHQLTSA